MNLALRSGQTVAFDRLGLSDAPAVLCLHGLSAERHTYRRLADHLGSRIASGRLQLLLADLRGHGESSHGPPSHYRASTYAQDMSEFIERLIDAPTLVVGHSLGGVVAASMAASRPDLVKGLFLEDPPHFEGDATVRNASPVAAFFPKLVAAVKRLQAQGADASQFRPLLAEITPPDEMDARANAFTRWDPATMQAAIDGIVWEGFDPEARILCPLTILRADPEFGAVFTSNDAERVRAANPHANIVLISGAGHTIRTGETLAGYLRELDAFLETNLR